ncbi:hypothetical protein EV421DRAFT_1858751 [Armillaria borealis]|uniref:F-box domain-containing protein n=1 Tax=Armillaria borealis TaxID=47425 RepID=A0AA39IVD7_9AGAR|nr:hypothetical protein EV421DRAFT_1858751 [Armillaria borealis]
MTLKNKGYESCPRCGFDSNTTMRLTDKPSPFRDLISVNGVASATDASLINDYLQKVHGEIQRLETIMKEAQEETIRLQSIVDSHGALMSSFRKFPPEVLATIFQHAIVTPPLQNSHWLPGDMAHVYDALCALGSVCRHWRATVLSTPSLWAQFCVRLPWIRPTESRLPLLEIILDRSREAHLSIGTSLMEFGCGKQNIRALLECLVPTSYRWKLASIEIDEDSVDIYEQLRGRLPLLERLELVSVSPNSEVSWETFRAFEDAPLLRELALGDGLSPVHKFALPWSQITSLYIDHQIEPDDLYTVFSITPGLQFLHLSAQNEDGGSTAWEPEDPNDFVVCSTVRHLDVADPALFRATTLPSVEEISIGLLPVHEEEDNKYEEDLFYDFLHRSQCPMRKLTVRLGENFDAFERIFDQAFRLTCLDITLHTVYSACSLFDVLASTKILPLLQSLKVVYIAPEAYDEYDDVNLGECIADLFKSRSLTFTAGMLSIHVEVIPCSNNAPRLGRGPYLSLMFWASFERRLRDTRLA